ncbi:MAG: HNH endonuclease, partial [Acidimicrobiales bacterium]
LHIHHLRHWEDGGTTDTENLLALCAHHHRLHHRGGLGMAGNADDPDGVAFTDERGRPLAVCGRPAPPKRSLAAAVSELDLPLAVASGY